MSIIKRQKNYEDKFCIEQKNCKVDYPDYGLTDEERMAQDMANNPDFENMMEDDLRENPQHYYD